MPSHSRRTLGGLYRRPNSPFWWMRYSVRGKQHRESTGVESIDEARVVLQNRLAEVAIYRIAPRDSRRVTVGMLAPLIVADYELRGFRSLASLKFSIKRLVERMGEVRIDDLSTPLLADFCRSMRADGYAEGTIAVTLAHFRRMLTLGVRQRLITAAQVPHLPKLHVDNARQGVVQLDELTRICAELRAARHPDVADAVEFGFYSAWRKGEILRSQWRDYSNDTHELRLPVLNDKTKRGRVLPITGALANVIARRQTARRLDCPLIFHRNGAPIRSFHLAWHRACERAGVKGRLFHDLRRTAVTNLVRAGVPIPVVMATSGHRTTHTFIRYNIIDTAALSDAQSRLAQFLASSGTKRATRRLRQK